MKINNKELYLQQTIETFEKEMYENMLSKKIVILDALECGLFSVDEDNHYCLQFNTDEKIYSITKVVFFPDEDDRHEEILLEKYSFEDYNREFLSLRIINLIYNHKLDPRRVEISNREGGIPSLKNILIPILINFDMVVYSGEEHRLHEFLRIKNVCSLVQYYSQMTEEDLLIAYGESIGFDNVEDKS
ncbi:hypothetical protein [Bacillus bombysepticus]|uniref:hypothetical protein n=1 Tax=Bacillus bombysepticus TaxID=658666 RepID=UPI0030180375